MELSKEKFIDIINMLGPEVSMGFEQPLPYDFDITSNAGLVFDSVDYFELAVYVETIYGLDKKAVKERLESIEGAMKLSDIKALIEDFNTGPDLTLDEIRVKI